VSKKEGKLHRCWKPRDSGRVLDFEYSQDGSEVWVSGWDKQGAIIIYDDAALKEATKLEGDWLVTPTRIYNAFNTATDVH
jgi:nitrite reductase (NO-forming)/hydroxylamine reductase